MRGYLIDVLNIISEELFKITILEPILKGTTKPLEFASLMNELCKIQEMVIPNYMRKKLRLPINKGYIQANCTNKCDNV